MNCQEFENLISGYLDSELSPDQKQSFELHSGQCASCRALVDEYKALDGIMRESEDFLPDEAYWSGFDARLNEKIQKAPVKKPWWSFITSVRRPALGWAAVTLLILMAFISPAMKTGFYSAVNTEKVAVHSPAASQNEAPGSEGVTAVSTKEEKESLVNPEEKGAETPGAQPSVARRKTSGEDLTVADKADLPKMESTAAGKMLAKPEVSNTDGNFAKKKQDDEYAAPADSIAGTKPAAPCAVILKDKDRKSSADAPCPKPEEAADEKRAEKFFAGGRDPFSPEKPPVHGNEYLSRSEVILIKIVNMNDDGHELAILQNSLKASSYEKLVGKDSEVLKEDPRLKGHAREMKIIADEVMNLNPKDIGRLKQQVIQSGILEKTRELKP